MSLGVIFLNKNETEYNTVRHEYGHCVQLDEVGMLKYLVFVAGPSVKGYWSGLSDSAYYSQPWEYGADMYGGLTEVMGIMKILLLLIILCIGIW